jgi:hypothetical protein
VIYLLKSGGWEPVGSPPTNHYSNGTYVNLLD